jgi:hypothetical protein
MSAHLSAVPSHELGAAVPGETTKWPWHLTNTDVIVRDPHHPGVTGAWPVIGEPNFVDGATVVYCETEDESGEGVFVYRASEQATVRAGTTYTLPALYTDDDRDEALRVLSCGDRAYIVGRLRADYREIYDQLLKRLGERETRITTATSQEAGTP